MVIGDGLFLHLVHTVMLGGQKCEELYCEGMLLHLACVITVDVVRLSLLYLACVVTVDRVRLSVLYAVCRAARYFATLSLGPARLMEHTQHTHHVMGACGAHIGLSMGLCKINLLSTYSNQFCKNNN